MKSTTKQAIDNLNKSFSLFIDSLEYHRFKEAAKTLNNLIEKQKK